MGRVDGKESPKSRKVDCKGSLADLSRVLKCLSPL